MFLASSQNYNKEFPQMVNDTEVHYYVEHLGEVAKDKKWKRCIERAQQQRLRQMGYNIPRRAAKQTLY